MSLSEQDLLLLDCFMYSDLAPKLNRGDCLSDVINSFTDPETGKISKALVEESGLQFSGDMSASKFVKVLTDMKKSDALMNLTLYDTTDEYVGSIRAACFVDQTTGKATVAFRGTGGSYQQWYNNFEGYGNLSQDTQDDAAAFIQSLPFDNIDVTGHSNGGDQAMYVAIVCEDKVSRCVSFEGQGVSKEFAETYAEQIARNKHKIKNICGEKDFVSPMLINVAGETVYVPSDSNLLDGLFDHGAYGLYSANSQVLSENGGYFPDSAYVDQAWYCQAINTLTVYLSQHSDTLFVGPALELLADVAGITVGLLINKNWKDPSNLVLACEDLIIALKDFVVEEVKDGIRALKEVCKRVVVWAKGFFNSGKADTPGPQILADTYKLNAYAQRIRAVQSRITRLDGRLDSLYWQVGLLDLWNLMRADLLTGYSWRLNRCANYLEDTASDFSKAEKDLVNNLQ